MTVLLLVAVGGSVGAVARFVVDGLMRARLLLVRTLSAFPFATIAINVSGSLLLGVLTGLTIYHAAPAQLSALLGTGFCGGYTTFSTASVETVRLVQQRRYGPALVSGVGTVVLTVAAAALGIVVGRAL